jgi:DNA-binding NtrC family response regulator
MSLQTVDIKNLEYSTKEGYLVPQDGKPAILIDGILSIGRGEECDLELKDPHVSLEHCRIEKRPGGYFIRDFKSRNGVLVNGLKVSEGQLLNGSQIQIGTTDFIFQTVRPELADQDLPIRTKNLEWKAQLSSIKSLSRTELPVFLQGESGTGKEVIAHLIHDQSERGEGPFISVNCSALTETLVESELFGHLKGSFTGATNDRKGAFEAARGGTLFLDEIGDLPLSLQPKLLRALENKEVKPVGSDKTVTTDVRIITATHKKLDKLVAEKLFRSDLYYRIHVVRLSIPALRERLEDFDDLLYYFCRENRIRFSVSAIEAMKAHSWPGNIRELKNTVSRAKALFSDTYIQPEHVAKLIDKPLPSLQNIAHHQATTDANSANPQQGSVLKEIEKEIIKHRLLANGGNQRRTATDLGIPKSTLHDRIKAYNIEVKSLLDL